MQRNSDREQGRTKERGQKSLVNAGAATPASTEQVFHLSYRTDEGIEAVGSGEMKEAELAGRCLCREAWDCCALLCLVLCAGAAAGLGA